MSKKIILYGKESSGPVRAVMLTLRALNLDYTLQIVDTSKGENQTAEFLKKNPQHTIPTLEDDGKYIWDSHAIMAYLASKYGKDDTLYPKDLYQRAVVDQRLHYESSVLYAVAKYKLRPLLMADITKEQYAEAVKTLHETYDMLECFLGDKQYFAGDNMTIADFSFLVWLATTMSVTPLLADKHTKLIAWLERMKKLPYYEEVNAKGAAQLEELIKSKLAQIQ